MEGRKRTDEKENGIDSKKRKERNREEGKMGHLALTHHTKHD